MTAVAGVDIGNATTEVAVVAGGRLVAADRAPTRGRKGSADSLRGAAALVRRVERRLGARVDEARIAPLRAADTATIVIPPLPPRTGRLRALEAGVATPGGTGACVGTPFWLDGPVPGGTAAGGRPARPLIGLVPARLDYTQAARRVRALLADGAEIRAVLTAGDEGVLIANRLGAPLPVLDQVDVAAAARCPLVAVEVRPPGQPLTVLGDPVALAAAFGLPDAEAGDAVALCRTLLDYSNAVIGCGPDGMGGEPADPAWDAAAGPDPAAGQEPWVSAGGERIALRAACGRAAGWPVGAVDAFAVGGAVTEVDDLFAVDLGEVGDAATARRGSVRRAALVASLHRAPPGPDPADVLAGLLGRPVRCLLSEPSAARLGALTTPGAAPDALVVDIGAGTIDVIAPAGDSGGPAMAEVVAAGAGDLLTAAVAETLGIPRAAADWVKRGPSLRVDGGQRFEAEDGARGFLDRPAPASAVGMLAVAGPAGLLPFGRGVSPGEWRAVRLRLKQAVFAVNLRRALSTLGAAAQQVLFVGGPAGDDELLGVLMRALPGQVAVGRGRVGAALGGPDAGHRHAAALGLALAPGDGIPQLGGPL